MSEFKYEQRCVAFLDVLGFSEFIEATIADSALVQMVGEIVTQPKHDLDNLRKMGGNLVPSVEVSAFSDSLVVSTLHDGPRAAFDLIQAVSLTSLRFLRAGRLLRGGIVSGLAFHESNIVFGPAVINAYRLEHEMAIFPRVIVEKSVAEEVKTDGRYANALELEGKPLLKEDRDGCLYLNPVNFFSEGLLIDAREVLRLIGKSTKQARDRMKVKWAIDEWNAAFRTHLIPELTDAEVAYEKGTPFEEIRTGKLLSLYSKLRPAPEN